MEWATFWLTLVGTVATVGALVVAMVLGVHEVRRFRREQLVRDQERRADDKRRRRAQAECISAVLTVNPTPATVQVGASGAGHAHSAFVTIVNSSSLPIYDARVSVPGPDGQTLTTRVGTFVAGGSEGHVHVPAQSSTDDDDEPVELRFRDSAGVHWHRLPDGLLHESDAHGDCPPEVAP